MVLCSFQRCMLSLVIFAWFFAFESVSEKSPKEETLYGSPPKFQIPKPRISMSALNALNRLSPPHAAAWPTQFSIMFLSNFSMFSGDESFNYPQAVKGHLSFSELSGLRISHGPGSHECQRSFNSNEGCSLQFHGNQLYVQFQTPRERVCCVNTARHSALSADWVTHGFIFNSTMRIMARMCHGFRRERDHFDEFKYWSDSVTKLPCAITFDDEPRLDMYFIPQSLKLGSGYLSPSLKDSVNCQNPCDRAVTTSLNLFV
jgi:hypothetical protein